MSTTGRDDKSHAFDEYLVGTHSVMLALEPRFMFDAAVAATDAEVIDQAAEAFAEACAAEEIESTVLFDDFSRSPLSAGDEGAFSLDGPGTMAVAASVNSQAELTVGDGSNDFTFTVDEDSVLNFTGENAIVIGDAENDVLIVTIEVENGVLNASRVPGVIYDGLGTGSITLTGSADAITEALLQLTYQGNKYYNSEDARYGPESLTITVKDYDPSLQTPERTIEKSYDLYVKPVNNAPEVDQPSDVNIEIEQNQTGSIPPITIFDPDYGDEITVTLRTENGILIFGDGVQYDFQAKGNGNDYNTYTIRGSVDEINAILADLGYKGEANFSGTDQIHLTVTDGKSDPVVTDPIDVLVTPVNQPPEISGTPDVPSADEGGSVILDESNFNVEDPDSSDAQIVFKILEDPEHGSLYYQAIAGDDNSWVKMGVGSIFTLEEVKDGRVRYSHNGSQVRPDTDPSSAIDGFRFSVSDSSGGSIDDVSLTIDLNPVNQAPEVSVKQDPDVRTDETGGTHLVVWEGEEDAVIKFAVDDPDQDPDTDHIVTFTGLPQDGTLYIVNDSGEKVEVILGMEVPMSWITAGRLTYSHNGADGAAVGKPMGETRDDSFSIRVRDDGGGGGSAAVKNWEGDLRIQVWPNNDDPEWTFPPEDVNVDSRNPQVIDNGHLNLSDPDSPSGDLTYTITQLPEHGNLYIRMWDSEKGEYYYVEVVAATYDPATGRWIGGTAITQDMINNGANPDTHDPVLVYQYPGPGPVEDLLDSIKFVVRDGAITSWDNDVPLDDKSHEGGIGEYNPETGRWELTEQSLNINVTIDPRDPGPGDLDIRQPEAAEIIIDGDLSIEVDEGGLVKITPDALSASYSEDDGDFDPSNLRYRLVDLPANGQLLRLESDGTYTVLTPGTLFYQSDIDAGLIFYQHNGSEVFTDSFHFSVSDGARDSDAETFTFNIRPVNDSPTVRPGDPIQVDENNAVDDQGNPDPYGSVDNGVVLGPDDIRLFDVDGSGERSDLSGYDEVNDLSFVVTNLPEHGRLYIYSGSGDRNDMANWILVQAVDFADTQSADWSSLAGYVITMQDLIDGNLMYFNDGEENISDGFTIVINDNMGVWNAPENGDNSVSDEFAILIGITPVNDPPRNDANETLVVDENGEGVISSGHLHFSDPDNSSNQVTYTVTSRPENGVLYLYTNGRWVALGEGSTFTQQDIDNGNLKYVHDGSEWHADSFTYSVSDGDAVLPDNVFDIDVNPVNKAPEVTLNGDDVLYLGVEDDMDLGGWFNIGDPDYDGDEKEVEDWMEMTITATVTEDKYFDHQSGVSAGTLFGIIGVNDLADLLATGDLELVQQADGTLVLRGTRAALQAALDALTYRSAYTSDPGTPIDINSAVTFTVELNDLNNGGGKDAGHDRDDGLVGSASGTIYVSPIDTPPSFNEDGPVQDKPVTLDVNEDDRLTIEYNGKPIQITDKDAFDRNNNTVTLSVDNGILWLSEIRGLTIQGNLSGEVILTGTLEAINEALATLRYVPEANWNGLDQLTISYGDAGNTGSGGPLEVEGVVNIHVHAVNDQPELNVTDEVISLDGSDTGSFQNINVPGSEYSIDDLIDLDPDLNNDPDLGNTDYFELTISLTHKDDLTDYFGELHADTNGGLTIEVREGGSVIVLKGSRDEINEALKSLSIRMTEAVEENAQFNLRFTLDDGRNGGLGPDVGAEGIIVKDVLILANNENDPATIHNTDDISLDEDSKYSFGIDGDAIVIEDPDALDFSLQLTLTVQHGYLNLNQALLDRLGLTVEYINGYNDAAGRHYTIIGSLDTINAVLAALVYTPEVDWNGSDTLQIYVNDRGNTTPGKPAGEINPLPQEQGGDGLVTVSTINITINPKNDSPVATENNVTLPSVHEDIESQANSGSTVDDLFGGLFNDVRDQKHNDASNPDGSESNAFIGIWVTGGVNAGNKGVWQYSSNGVDWYDITEGMFLDKDAAIRFQPSQDYNVRRGEIPDLEVRLVESNEYAAGATTDLTTGSTYESTDLQRDGVPRYTDVVTLSHEVIPVNDAPEITAPETTPATPLEVDEDAPLAFTGPNQIIITDVDADPSESPDYEMTITLSVENGTLSLDDFSGLSGYDGPSGTLTLTGTLSDINEALATLKYQGNENYYGQDQLTITINDRGDGSEEQGTGELNDSAVIHLAILSVNDAPVIDTSPDASVLEDGTLAFTDENAISISDVDLDRGEGDHLMTVTLSGIENGTLTLDSQYADLITSGGNGTGSITLTGTLDEINAALASLVYTPNADWNGSETLTVTANDNGNYGSGGPQETSFEVAITVVPINDAPEATEGAVAMDPIDEDTTNASGQTVEDLFGGIFQDNRDEVTDGSDADDFAGIVIVGNNANADEGTWQYYDADTGQWVSIPTDVADDNAIYLSADTPLRFVPNADYYGTPGDLQVRLVDNAAMDPNNPSLTELPESGTSGLDVSDNGGTTRYSDDVVVLTIVVNPVNDAPVIITSPDASVLEDGSLAFSGDNAIVISDVDIGGGDGSHEMTVTLSGIENGTLTLDSQYGDLITGGGNGTGSITLSGTLDEINAALASLVYTPNADWNGSETLTVTANDNGNYGSGDAQETSFEVAITVVPINDAPEATEGAVAMDPIDEDTTSSSGQTVEDLFGGIFQDTRDEVTDGSDADDFAGIVIVGNNASSDEGTWQYYDANTGQWASIPTDVADENAIYLSADTPLRFVPNADYYGTPGDLQVRLVDNAAMDPNNPSLTELPESGTSGLDVSDNGGTTRYSDDVVVLTIVVNPVNDAPVISTSPDASVLEDGSFAFSGDNAIVISDVDIAGGDGSHEMTVTLSGIENGSLTLDSEYADLITAGGNGTGSITLSGTLDEINAALASLVYTPNADWNGSETLTVTANDNGNYGSGDAQETSFEVAITVVPINDAPEATEGAVAMDPIDEDTTDSSGQTVEDLFGGIFQDTRDEVTDGSDADDFAGIVIVGNNANPEQGTWQYYDDGTGTWVDIPSNLSDGNGLFLATDTALRFLPQPDFNGTPGGLQVRLVDSAPLDDNNPDLSALPENGSTGVDVRDNGGTTRYSAEVVALTIQVTAVNDAPTRNGEEIVDTGLTAYYRENGEYPVWTVEEMMAGKFADNRDYQRDKADDGSLENDFAGIAVTDLPDPQYGHYEYFDGTDWIRIDQSLVNDTTALLLSKDTQMRFVPVADITGAPDLYATVRLIDSSGGPVITGGQIDKSVLNENYDQTGVYSDSDNAVVLVITAIGKNTPPYVDDLPGDLQVRERDDPVRIAEGSTVGDRELLNIPDIGWEEFTITIRREGGANAEDVFTYWNGNEFVDIGAGDSLYYEGVLVGEVVRNAEGEIVLKFNGEADQESVSAILGNVGYSINTHQPPESVTMQYILNDGNFDDRQGDGGELEGFANQVITIIPVPEDPIAEDNFGYIQLDENRGGETEGNILHNAYDPDGTPVHVVDPDRLEGEYGYLTVDSDGNYVYIINPDHPDVMNLRPGQQLVDEIEYQVGDGNDGKPATATLTIIIETTINRVILPPATDGPNVDQLTETHYDWDSHTYRPLWSFDRRNGMEDRLRLADLLVDKPVVPAVRRANGVSDWEIASALSALQRYGIDTDALAEQWSEGILQGVTLTKVSLQAVPADSFLIHRISVGAATDGRQGDVALHASMADGSPLPYWVFFDAENESLTVTPPEGTAGEYYVIIIAVDAEGEKTAEAVVFSVTAPLEEKPEALPFERVDSATERDALENDTLRHDVYWEPGMLRDAEFEKSILTGAPALAGQLSLIGSYGIARRAKRLEHAAQSASRKR